ncbi:hypothetical protein ADIARSV_0697 [Arcticibacter svalbardensis MN12-7]|uniref:DUF3606 domain-containing protein n=1 Tax=Arcticibacter svalbardensis MN12-7 TaxID=1150600 RepID=R9GWL0_9SPHI|nr:DUF3606 domain-containing protein [Arcticibacter svalbardensis]EOR96053.1 hypothetical protein ADIARSV_0697 [Arcticibacter svalbardensis MN12-7]
MKTANKSYKEKTLISMYIDEEVDYWAKKWGVSKESIKSAVKALRSNSITDVHDYLFGKEVTK